MGPVLSDRPKVTAQFDSSELMCSGSQRELIKKNQRIGLWASSQDKEATLFCFGKEVSSLLIIVLQEKEHQGFLKVQTLHMVQAET